MDRPKPTAAAVDALIGIMVHRPRPNDVLPVDLRRARAASSEGAGHGMQRVRVWAHHDPCEYSDTQERATLDTRTFCVNACVFPLMTGVLMTGVEIMLLAGISSTGHGVADARPLAAFVFRCLRGGPPERLPGSGLQTGPIAVRQFRHRRVAPNRL